MFADVHLVKQSWDRIEPIAGRVAAQFYARLFVEAPELRELFPMVLGGQQEHFVLALRRVVQGLDSPLLLERYLHQLGQDHRKFAVRPEFYLPFGRALIATLREHSAEWDDRIEEAWITAYATVADRMMAGASDAGRGPAWWDAVVVAHHRPAPDIAVITLRPDRSYGFYPGQYLTLQTPRRSRLWRPYSIANAPRPDGTLELHVRAVPGGEVSGALVRHTTVGDPVRLGPPLGTMQVDPDSDRDLLFVAGGTGLAPCKAMLEHVARWNNRRQASIFYGARRTDDLYGLSALFRFAQGLPWLTVVGAVSDDPTYFGRRGVVCDVAIGAGDWSGRDVYVAGPPGMVPVTVDMLRRHGVPLARISYDPITAPA
jgi:NAD(P)H-flavin reductase/hemoglobin-like flavoprotein